MFEAGNTLEEATDVMEGSHLEFAFAESFVSARERAWLAWVEVSEGLLGHDLDGDQDADGYSLDYAHDAFCADLTPAEYVAEVARG